MDYIETIQEILKLHISESEHTTEVYKNILLQTELYNEILTYKDLSFEEIYNNRYMICLLLDTIYKNKIQSNNFLKKINKAKLDPSNIENNNYLERFFLWIDTQKSSNQNRERLLLNKIYNQNKLLSTAKKTIKFLEKKLPIKLNNIEYKELINILKLSYKNGFINDKDLVILINTIELYNRKVYSEKTQSEAEIKDVTRRMNEIYNIINIGFPKLEDVEVKETKRKQLNNTATSIYDLLKEETDPLEIIKECQEMGYDYQEFRYIITKVLNKYIDDLITYSNCLKDIEMFSQKELRKDIIEEFYKILDNFLIIYKYYETKNNETVIEENIKEPEIINSESPKARLIYSYSQPIVSKSRIIIDLKKDIPEEYYERVLSLITEFKQNPNTTKVKNLPNFPNILEIKEDQIRILFQPIKNNVYCILGVGVKKTNSDIKLLSTISSRDVPKVDTEQALETQLFFSQKVEEELENLVITKGRKGNR